MTSPIEDTLFALLAAIPAGKTISPEDVARTMDLEGWRRMLPKVRAEAVGLARQGKLVITRHNKPADPGKFKGVYRLRLPMAGDVVPSSDEAGDKGGDELSARSGDSA